MRTIRRAAVVLLVILVLAAVGFVIWGSTPLGPLPEARAALVSDSRVEVKTERWLVFQPTGQAHTTGFIFYPGGRVHPASYAPAARAIAEQGYLVVIVPMPLNLAVFGANRAGDAMRVYSDTQHWVVGGHSLGGAMAAAYVYGHPDAAQGLALWAAYPAGNNSLANRDVKVVSIFGTRDGLATGPKIDASRPLLPADTVWVPIEGGNHAQFGWYGLQPGDGQATISREEQQAAIVKATVELLAKVDEDK